MSNVIDFPKPKLKPVDSWPEWKRSLFDQWRNSDSWVLTGKGRWFNVPRFYAAIFPVTVVGDDGEDEAWWSYSVHGAPEPEMTWFEPTEAEWAAWDALVTLAEARAKRRRRR